MTKNNKDTIKPIEMIVLMNAAQSKRNEICDRIKM